MLPAGRFGGIKLPEARQVEKSFRNPDASQSGCLFLFCGTLQQPAQKLVPFSFDDMSLATSPQGQGRNIKISILN